MAQETADSPKPATPYRHPDPITDAALDWFVALQGEGADRAAFERWRAADSRHEQAFAQVVRVADMPELRQDLRQGTPRASNPAGRRAWLGAALAASLVLGVGLSLSWSLSPSWTADYATATGEQQTVTLPDGSRVLLNSASALALDFQAGRRAVKLLAGEAFFDVQPDPAHPFQVLAGFSTVEVKGTAFAVRRDAAGDRITLDHGRVAVSPHAEPGRFVLLAPGDQVSASAQGLSAVVRVDPARVLAWREGRYRFEDEAFGAVVANFQRYYSGRIILFGAGLETVRVSGSFRLDDPVGALRSLAQTAGARLEALPGGLIFIR